MTRDEFRRMLMTQANGAASDNIVDVCLMFQLEYGMDGDAMLEMQSTRFDLMVGAHNERVRCQNEALKEHRGVKRFGYG